MWSVCVIPGKNSFTYEGDAVQALKKMNEGHEDKGVDKEDNANDKVTEATKHEEREKVLDAESKGGGDEPDGDGTAELSGAADPSHGEGVTEPNSDDDSDAGKMDEWESPRKADEKMVCTDAKEGTKEVDEPMEDEEQGGEPKPTEDVNDMPTSPSDKMSPSCKSARAMRHPRRTRRTGRFRMQRKSYGAHHPGNHARSKPTSYKGSGENKETWQSPSEAPPCSC